MRRRAFITLLGGAVALPIAAHAAALPSPVMNSRRRIVMPF
jgi:hypothetical protein